MGRTRNKLGNEYKLSAQLRLRMPPQQAAVDQSSHYQHIETPLLTNMPCYSAWSQRLIKTSSHLSASLFQLNCETSAGLINTGGNSTRQTSSSTEHEKQHLNWKYTQNITIIFFPAIKEQVQKAFNSAVLR